MSRRLARALHSDLKKGKLGYVKVSVEAFHTLVKACDSRFARLYAQELLIKFPKKSVGFAMLHKTDSNAPVSYETSVVGALLSSKDMRAQKMGIDILLTILKTQDSAEYISKLDNFVPLLCKIAIDDATGGHTHTGEDGKTVSASSLQCLLEHLRLCSRISFIARHMDGITEAALTIIDREGDAAIATYEACRDTQGEGSVNLLALSKLSMGSRIGAASPCQAAVLIFKEIGATTHDSVESRNVTEYWIHFMEKVPSRWSGGPALDVGLGVLRDSCKLDHQKYALACSLIRHLASLGERGIEYQNGALVKIILSQAFLLGAADVASLLLLTIKSVGGLLSLKTIEQPSAQVVYDAIQHIALKTSSRTQIASVIEAALSHVSSDESVIGIIWLCEAASSVYLDIPLQQSEDCNVTETMVSAIKNICANINDDKEHQKTIILKSLTILRHTFEATAPGSHTSVRCARVLVAYLWTMLSSPSATPDIFIVIQAVFRSFTETDITCNEDLAISVLFVASLNLQLSAYVGSPDKEFCSRQHVPACQVTAAAAIADSMWECLKNSMKHTDPSLFDGFKPKLLGDDESRLLCVNSIGMAVSKDTASGSVPFTEQPDKYNADGMFSCSQNSPEEIFKRVAGSSRRSTIVEDVNIAAIRNSDIGVAPGSIVAALEGIDMHVLSGNTIDSPSHHSLSSSTSSLTSSRPQGRDDNDDCVANNTFATSAEAIAWISRHLIHQSTM